MHYVTVDGQKYTYEEYEEIRKQEEEKRRSEQEEASRLVREAGEAFRRAQEFIQSRPQLVRQVGDAEAVEHELFEKLRKNLDRADEAPRCEKVLEDGTKCGCPRMTGYNYCYAHERMLAARARKLELPALEDGNGIQMALMLVQRALIDDEISVKKAGLLLYSLQTAALNLKNTTFCEAEEEYLVREMPTEGTEGENVVKGKTVWTSQYEKPTTETRRKDRVTTPPPAQNQPGPGTPVIGESGDRVIGKPDLTTEAQKRGEIEENSCRRLPQISADGEGGIGNEVLVTLVGHKGATIDPKTAQAGVVPPHQAKRLSGTPVPVPHKREEDRVGMGRVSLLDLGMEREG